MTTVFTSQGGGQNILLAIQPTVLLKNPNMKKYCNRKKDSMDEKSTQTL